MNIVQQAEALKDLSDNQIRAEMKTPSGMFPLYLVTSEAKRRQVMRDRSKSEEAETPSTTVQQDLLTKLAQQTQTPGLPLASSPATGAMRPAAPQMPPQAGPQMPPQAGPQMPPQAGPRMPPTQAPRGFAGGGKVRGYGLGGLSSTNRSQVMSRSPTAYASVWERPTDRWLQRGVPARAQPAPPPSYGGDAVPLGQQGGGLGGLMIQGVPGGPAPRPLPLGWVTNPGAGAPSPQRSLAAATGAGGTLPPWLQPRPNAPLSPQEVTAYIAQTRRAYPTGPAPTPPWLARGASPLGGVRGYFNGGGISSDATNAGAVAALQGGGGDIVLQDLAKFKDATDPQGRWRYLNAKALYDGLTPKETKEQRALLDDRNIQFLEGRVREAKKTIDERARNAMGYGAALPKLLGKPPSRQHELTSPELTKAQDSLNEYQAYVRGATEAATKVDQRGYAGGGVLGARRAVPANYQHGIQGQFSFFSPRIVEEKQQEEVEPTYNPNYDALNDPAFKEKYYAPKISGIGGQIIPGQYQTMTPIGHTTPQPLGKWVPSGMGGSRLTIPSAEQARAEFPGPKTYTPPPDSSDFLRNLRPTPPARTITSPPAGYRPGFEGEFNQFRGFAAGGNIRTQYNPAADYRHGVENQFSFFGPRGPAERGNRMTTGIGGLSPSSTAGDFIEASRGLPPAPTGTVIHPQLMAESMGQQFGRPNPWARYQGTTSTQVPPVARSIAPRPAGYRPGFENEFNQFPGGALDDVSLGLIGAPPAGSQPVGRQPAPPPSFGGSAGLLPYNMLSQSQRSQVSPGQYRNFAAQGGLVRGFRNGASTDGGFATNVRLNPRIPVYDMPAQYSRYAGQPPLGPPASPEFIENQQKQLDWMETERIRKTTGPDAPSRKFSRIADQPASHATNIFPSSYGTGLPRVVEPIIEHEQKSYAVPPPPTIEDAASADASELTPPGLPTFDNLKSYPAPTPLDYSGELEKSHKLLTEQRGTPYASFAEIMAKRTKDVGDDAASAKWMALAEAGFAIAAGESQHALVNIGKGAQQGVKSLKESQKWIQGRKDKNLALDIQLKAAEVAHRDKTEELATQRANGEISAQRANQEATANNNRLDLQRTKINLETAFNNATLLQDRWKTLVQLAEPPDIVQAFEFWQKMPEGDEKKLLENIITADADSKLATTTNRQVGYFQKMLDDMVYVPGDQITPELIAQMKKEWARYPGANPLFAAYLIGPYEASLKSGGGDTGLHKGQDGTTTYRKVTTDVPSGLF